MVLWANCMCMCWDMMYLMPRPCRAHAASSQA